MFRDRLGTPALRHKNELNLSVDITPRALKTTVNSTSDLQNLLLSFYSGQITLRATTPG